MGGQLGVTNLKKCLDVAYELGNVLEDAAAPNQSLSQRLGHSMQLLDELMALPGVDFSKVDDEVRDLDDGDKAELLAHMKQKFDLDDDVLEAKVEEGVALAADLASTVVRSVKYVGTLKGDTPEAA